MARAALPYILYVLGVLFLVALLLLLGFFYFKSEIAELLHAGVNLLQLQLWGISWRNDLRHCLFHGPALAYKIL